jgi:hypothetical protein
VFEVTVKLAAAVAPIIIAVAPLHEVPVTVTVVPPTTVSTVGEMLVTVEPGGGVT